MDWYRLDSEEQLASIVEDSRSEPVMIFKHSTRCATSAVVFDRLNRSWNDDEMKRITPYYLDLISYRTISNQIAEKFGVWHESPQVLIIWDGKCVYNNSHLGVSYRELKSIVDGLIAAH